MRLIGSRGCGACKPCRRCSCGRAVRPCSGASCLLNSRGGPDDGPVAARELGSARPGMFRGAPKSIAGYPRRPALRSNSRRNRPGSWRCDMRGRMRWRGDVRRGMGWSRDVRRGMGWCSDVRRGMGRRREVRCWGRSHARRRRSHSWRWCSWRGMWSGRRGRWPRPFLALRKCRACG